MAVCRRFAQSLAHRLRAQGGWLVVWMTALAVTFAVGAAPRVLAEPIPECSGAQSLNFGCLASRYEALTRRSGADAALADLQRARATNSYLDLGCHQMAHVIGRTAGALSGQAAFQDGSDLCASGFYHGVTESVMQALGPGNVAERAQEVCGALREADGQSYLHYNCVHGMGHGFMAVYGNDVFRSLAGCEGLGEAWEQQFCFSGVFMENLSGIGDPARPTTDLRPTEPLYPCTAVRDQYKSQCYLKQTAYALYVHHGDFGAVFRLCRETGDFAFVAICDRGLGGDAAITSSKYVNGVAAQVATVRQLCLLGPDQEAHANCIVGAVETAVRDLAGDDTKALALCAVLEAGPLADVCRETIEVARQGVPAPAGAHHHQ